MPFFSESDRYFSFFDDCHTRAMLGPSHRERDTCSPFRTLVAVFSFSLSRSLPPGTSQPSTTFLSFSETAAPQRKAGLFSLSNRYIACLLTFLGEVQEVNAMASDQFKAKTSGAIKTSQHGLSSKI